MKLLTTKPGELSARDIASVNSVVATAFGYQRDVSPMLQDTKQHLAEADTVQIMHEDEVPIALAMYRSCLWRCSN